MLIGLAVSPALGAAVAWLVMRAIRPGMRRASKRLRRPVLGGEWVASAALSFTHGANDAQKTMGVVTLALVAGGALSSFVVPMWVKVACGAALTIGTALGGWRIVHTIGRRIYRLRARPTASTPTASGRPARSRRRGPEGPAKSRS